MKKLILLLVAAVFLSALLTGCSFKAILDEAGIKIEDGGIKLEGDNGEELSIATNKDGSVKIETSDGEMVIGGDEGISVKDNEGNEAEFGAKIPDGYPMEIIPLAEYTEIVVGYKTDTEHGAGYMVSFYSKDSFEDVKSFYIGKLNGENVSHVDLTEIFSLVAENYSGYDCTVSISYDPDTPEVKPYVSISMAAAAPAGDPE